MKRVIVCIGLSFFVSYYALAQTPVKSGVKKQQVNTKKIVGKKANTKQKTSILSKGTGSNHTELTSIGTYNALGNTPSAKERLIIADPVIKTLNERANLPVGVDVPGSGNFGMPKLTYGIARGQLIFRSTSAPTIGTSTGSGAVGTGTTVGAIGAAGNTIGVNGKNPYAGPGIYGLPLTDETGTKVTVEGSRPKGIRRKQ